jgi:formylglycine-generating enzyme
LIIRYLDCIAKGIQGGYSGSKCLKYSRGVSFHQKIRFFVKRMTKMLENTDISHNIYLKRLLLFLTIGLLSGGAIWFFISKNKKSTEDTLPATKKQVIVIEPAMVTVQGGTFDMGDTFNETSDRGGEKPVHTVRLDGYKIGKYEVSFEEYDSFCEATNRLKPNDENWGRGKQPVINVHWADAVAYCQWLKDSTGKNYRLPTEAEWEYAARERGKKVRFGNGKNTANPTELNFDGSAAFKKDYSILGEYRNKAVKVDSLSANALGLHHMSGNVLEWCSDFYGNYGKSAVSNPQGAATGAYRVIRGGSWRNSPLGCRASFRGYSTHTFQGYYLGFRVALSL